jgi:diguanylate cyclase (GGDEF)-like protein
MRFLFPAISLAVGCLTLLASLAGSADGASILDLPTHPASAFGILATAAAVILFQFNAPPAAVKWLRLLLSVGVALMGIAEFSDTLLGTRFGFTQNTGYIRIANGPIGMAPNTSFCFIVFGLSLILSRSVRLTDQRPALLRSILVSQGFAAMGGLVALLAIVGHVYRAGSFVALDGARPMTLNTALCFIFIALGILQVEPRRGWVRYVVNDGPGGYMAKFLLPVAVLMPIGLGWLRVAAVKAHLYDADYGVALSALLNIVMLVGIILLAARKLHQLDQKARQVEAELLYRATHDSLTGLVNRPVFREQLLRRIKLAARHATPRFAVFFLDLDGFKQVNDLLGHDAGDRLLVEIADILRQCTRGSDTVARFGGDEFVILFEELEGPSDAEMLADRIVHAVPRRFGKGERTVPIGISIGVAVSGGALSNPDEILQEADAALYRAKMNGKGRFEISRQQEPAA